MTHWFDELTKNLAGMFASGPLAPSEPTVTVPVIGPVADLCGRRKANKGTLDIREVSLSQDGVTLDRQVAYNRTTQASQSSITLRKGQTVIVKVDTSATKEGTVNSTTTYGPGVQGAKSVTMASKNGRLFQGSVDGRDFSMSKSLRTPRITFVDNKPAPQIVVDPNLAAVARRLADEVDKSLRTCGSAVALTTSLAMEVNRSSAPGTAPDRPRLSPRRLLDIEPLRNIIPAPGRDWYEPGGEDHVTCLQCYDDCNKTYFDTTTNLGCILAEFACVPEALAQWGICMGVCQVPGKSGGCLPNPCGFFQTCTPGDKCFNFQGGNLCCQAPAAVCQNVCCGKDITSCAPDGSCGCTAEQTPCGNECCDPKTQTCVQGVCCPIHQPILVNGVCCGALGVCGKVCCDELSKCADPNHGVCCSFVSAVCAGQCCEPGAQCIKGACCAQDSICGGVCCPKGETCINPATHKCSPCPSGTVPCMPDGGTGLCCPPNVDCCADKCCKPGEWCRASEIAGKVTYYCGPPEVPS